MDAGELPGDGGILLVVATLVATITFEAALNPPGGTIDLPYEIGKQETNSSHHMLNDTWYTSWRNPHPAGMPILLWKLKAFFLLDTVALFTSIIVILFLLSGVAQKSKLMMKFLSWLMWFAVFTTLLAFIAVFNALYGHSYAHKWSGYLYLWLAVFGVGSIWIFIQSTVVLLIRAELVTENRPEWMIRIGRLCTRSRRLKKVVCIVLIVCILIVLLIVNWGLYLVFPYITAH